MTFCKSDPGHFNRVMKDPGHFNRVMKDPRHFNRVMRDPGHFNRLMGVPKLSSIHRGDPINFDRAIGRPDQFEKFNIDQDQFDTALKDKKNFDLRNKQEKEQRPRKYLISLVSSGSGSPDYQRTIQRTENSQTENRGEVLHDTNGNPPEIWEKPVANMVTSASTAKARPKWFMRFLRDVPQPKYALARLM